MGLPRVGGFAGSLLRQQGCEDMLAFGSERPLDAARHFRHCSGAAGVQQAQRTVKVFCHVYAPAN
jgi:hypothetical protein